MGKSRKVSSISKEFDGKEVQGKLIERSGLFGSSVSKEVFKMPGGGKHIEKTRTNKKGDVVSRMSKDTKVNPLVFFNKNKAEAYKKAGGAMDAYKKSLKKAQDGFEIGEDPENMMISKPGYGAKKSNMSMNNVVNPILNGPVRSNAYFQRKYGTRYKPAEIMTKEEAEAKGIVHKKGGSVKRKK